jgi:hypothetical protein
MSRRLHSKGKSGFRWAIVLLLLVTLSFTNIAPASAASRTLFKSTSLRLDGRLTPRKLLITHTNLTDFPLRFRCRTRVEGVRYRTRGTLTPHEVWTTRFRTSASRLRGATASCRVTVQDDLTLFWKGDLVEVLGEGFIQSTGDPQTNLYFFSITANSVSFSCTWQWGNPPSPGTWTETLGGYGSDSFSVGGIDISTVSGFSCTESSA